MTTTGTTSGQATLSVFQGDRLVRSGERYCAGGREGHSALWPHVAWFCRICGEIWRREVYTYHFDYRPECGDRWTIVQNICDKCGEPEVRRLFAELLEEYK